MGSNEHEEYFIKIEEDEGGFTAVFTHLLHSYDIDRTDIDEMIYGGRADYPLSAVENLIMKFRKNKLARKYNPEFEKVVNRFIGEE